MNAIEILMQHMNIEVRIAHFNNKYKVFCYCRDEEITCSYNAKLSLAMRETFTHLVYLQGMPYEEIMEINNSIIQATL